jgi:hypothetical protein
MNDKNQFKDWTPTPENINALPDPIRQYIHDLETNADPSGNIRDAICQRETAMALAKRVEELEKALELCKITLTRDMSTPLPASAFQKAIDIADAVL